MAVFDFDRTDDDYTSFAEPREAQGLDLDPDRSSENLVRSGVVQQDGYEDMLLYGTHTKPEGTRIHHMYSQGIEFIDEAADRSEPWCLTVSTAAPHNPFLAPEEPYEQYDVENIPRPENFDDQMEGLC